MGRKRKDASRQIKSTIELANYQAATLISLHGVKKAERIADLTLQKIRASQKRLKDKYGDEKNTDW